MERIPKDNTAVIKLVLTDDEDATVTGATVTATLYEADASTEVTGITQPITLTHQSGGIYEGTLSEDANVTIGKQYWAKVTAVDGSTQLVGWQKAYCERREL